MPPLMDDHSVRPLRYTARLWDTPWRWEHQNERWSFLSPAISIRSCCANAEAIKPRSHQGGRMVFSSHHSHEGNYLSSPFIVLLLGELRAGDGSLNFPLWWTVLPAFPLCMLPKATLAVPDERSFYNHGNWWSNMVISRHIILDKYTWWHGESQKLWAL